MLTNLINNELIQKLTNIKLIINDIINGLYEKEQILKIFDNNIYNKLNNAMDLIYKL